MRDKPKVGEILVRAGIIDELQLSSALGEQSRWGRRLGMTLVKLGMVAEGQLVRALAKQFDLPVASLVGKKIAPEVIALVPAKTALEHSVIPLFVKQEGRRAQLFLGMEEPSDLLVLDELAFRTGMSIRPVMVAPSELGEAIDRYYAGASPSTTSASTSSPSPSSSTTPMPTGAAIAFDPTRGGETLDEANLRSLRDEPAPTLSALLRPGPTPVDLTSVDARDAVDSDESTSPLAQPIAKLDLVAAGAKAPQSPTAPTPAAPIAATTPIASVSATPPIPPIAPIAPVAARATAAAGTTAAPAPISAPAPLARTSESDALAREFARVLEETERTRLVAKAIAHLLIEKGILTLEELQARIEKAKAGRAEGSA